MVARLVAEQPQEVAVQVLQVLQVPTLEHREPVALMPGLERLQELARARVALEQALRLAVPQQGPAAARRPPGQDLRQQAQAMLAPVAKARNPMKATGPPTGARQSQRPMPR